MKLLTKHKGATIALILSSAVIALKVFADCGYYNITSTGTCGGLAGSTGCDDTPPCQLITCPSDWSCSSGSTYIICDNPPYTAQCDLSYGTCQWFFYWFCGNFVYSRSLGSFPCHAGNTLSCGG